MNFPILILIGVLAAYTVVGSCVAQSSASPTQSQSQQQPAQTASPSQQPNPPSTQSAQPCAESKETCELPPDATAPHQTEPSSATQPPKSTAAKPKPAKHKRRRKKTTAQSTSATGPKKIIVRNGGTSELNSALSPGITASQANYSLQNTNQLLSSTDANLKEACSRPLNPTQQSTVDQIRVFMEQANEAVKAGDLDRAHNLAVKAHLLSADLVKH